MMHRQHGRGVGPTGNHTLNICRQLGIPYPPEATQVYAFVQNVKHDAERALKANRLQDSERLYSIGLMGIQLGLNVPVIAEEHHRLLANRSLVNLKMRRFREAEVDAKTAIAVCPAYVKGYWRASQAVKGGYNGAERALVYLIEGLSQATVYGDQADVVTFLTEICTLVPRAPKTESMESKLWELDLPDADPESELDDSGDDLQEQRKEASQTWNRVAARLASTGHWNSLALIVNGYNNGPECELNSLCVNWDTAGIDVGDLVAQVSSVEMKNWGEELAVSLIQSGSSVHDIGTKSSLPTLHTCIKLSFITGRIRLFEIVLEKLVKEGRQNDVAQDGNTGLHFLLKTYPHSDLRRNVLKMLLDHHCSAILLNHEAKLPIDCLAENDPDYALLKANTKSVDELRADLEELKASGNQALKNGDHYGSLSLYDQALAISQQSTLLYKEAAILYSNKANAFFSLHKYQDCLANALAAISCDINYHKGHWWKGKCLMTMGANQEAFSAFMDGHVKSDVSTDIRLSFLMEAVTLVKALTDSEALSSYGQLRFLDKSVWPPVLQRLSRTVDWRSIAVLVLGHDLRPQRFNEKLTASNLESLCIGVVGTHHIDDVQTSTVFTFIEQNTLSSFRHWLVPCVYAMLKYGTRLCVQNLVTGNQESTLQAAVRFCLLTGTSNVLEDQSIKGLTDAGGNQSVFHTVTKHRPPPSQALMNKLIKQLIKRGISAQNRDSSGKLPVDYLDNQYPGKIFDLFFQANQGSSVDEILRLKSVGNDYFKKGDVLLAMEMYEQAINLFERSQGQADQLSNREVAVLYGNRAEAFIKLGIYDRAYRDAMESVARDGHWYKGHSRVGRALRGQERFEPAVKAFVNAYHALDSQDAACVGILTELASICQLINWGVKQTNKVEGFPRQHAHLWARASYELVCKQNWLAAKVAHAHFNSTSNKKRPHLTDSLKPFCDLKALKANPWALEVMVFMLECGCNRKSITLVTGETYLHAVVRITLTTEKLHLLQYVVRQFCHVRRDTDQYQVDSSGNTVCHTATSTHTSNKKLRHSVLTQLLKCGVNPNLLNHSRRLAIDYVSSSEQESMELLRMAMFNKEDVERKLSAGQPLRRDTKPAPTVPKPVPEKKPDRSCNMCEDLLSQGTILLTEENVGEGYGKLVECIVLKHHGSRHESIVRRCVSAIVQKLAETNNPEIPSCLLSVGTDWYSQLLTGLAAGNKWRQLDLLVRKYRTVHGKDQLKGFAQELTVLQLVRDSSLQGAEDVKLQIMISLLSSGASLGSDNGESAIQSAVSCCHYRVLGELVRRGANTRSLSVYPGDTPIHAVVNICLDKDKSISLLEYVLEEYKGNPDLHSHLNPDQLDKEGNCLFHLVAKAKYTSHALKVTELLCRQSLSANYTNVSGKLPVDYISRKNDRRLQYLRLARAVQPRSQQVPVAKETDSLADLAARDQRVDSSGDRSRDPDQEIEVTRVISVHDRRYKHIEEMIKSLQDSGPSALIVEALGEQADEEESRDNRNNNGTADDCSEDNDSFVTANDDSILDTNQNSQTDIQEGDKPGITIETEEEDVKAEPLNREEAPQRGVRVDQDEALDGEQAAGALGAGVQNGDSESDSEEEQEEVDQMEIDVQVFDNLEWEVECTADVWKTLRDKHVPSALKRRVIHKIQLLACGDWQPHLCKKLKHSVPTLNLFEAKFSKGRRILWELAVAFSPRLSESAERRLQVSKDSSSQPVLGGRIYSEIIRVWDIVLDHDKIYRSVQRINKSHQRGEECIIQKKLRGMRQQDQGSGRRIPLLYAEEEVTEAEMQQKQQELKEYYPPASSNETEYHILKFYSFTSTLVSHVLQNIEAKVDFPFRVTDLEHAIIHLQSNAPILLLGRSGTGKTTCCMYRLWSQFISYWLKARQAEAPLLPRCVEYLQEDPSNADLVDSDTGSEDESESGSVSDSELGACRGGDDQPEVSEEQQDGPVVKYDHLHQVFITKNSVLCSEVQKNFRELSHGEDWMQEYRDHEGEALPAKLQDVQEHMYPLFVTSRQLVLMLDASLPTPHFFDRKDDGSLKVDVEGWSEGDGPLSYLPLHDEDSDSEEEEEGDEEFLEQPGATSAHTKQKVDPRREVTYPVFVEEIWPRITKGKTSYHASLIWTEIMSFIKGSFEALSKRQGFLTLGEYEKLGRKRAPNFSGTRPDIYSLYRKYEHFKRQHLLFDETDIVHDVFRRLRLMPVRDWVIHQVYVDETQDFTQAELCLLIRICHNPNAMFLTGDTAQSIMRGISFRFSDLRSLFYHARHTTQTRGKTSAVQVPKQVYQLVHNYRSHAGILSLATSVLDLMVEFFPESFDRLQPDQGLFHGPPPILLESCSFSDLAVLLRGNKRKTSHIEFGAHQAILVVNDASRESIPEELRLGLVLTIYEAKGLEFDDVLLYNFFKDSQASKEWRVVTDYLERLAAGNPPNQSASHDSLITIDHEVLKSAKRPRALQFDQNQHKVLNSELKHLYTALTRARVNVWIFDEDLEKRAPMFEYFKVRRLVKDLQIQEINETSLSETMFAEKSSPGDWIRRGEDFMRHSLYSVAAKCFSMGGDQDRMMLALAHGQALQASRSKDHPRQMREEFLHAAELYMECNRTQKAAICLQNAKEWQLAAELYEKLGKYEKAGEVYRRLKLPIASSRCYEQRGNFNKALDVLTENGNYAMAMDTLRRYHILKQDHVQKGTVPGENVVELDKFYTEERLSHKAAEFYHKHKNEERMLEAVDKFKELGDRVEFLKNKGYIVHAANMLANSGDCESATAMLLMYGRYTEANIMARRTLDEATIGHTLLVTCRYWMSKLDNMESPPDYLLDGLKEAIQMFQECKDTDRFGAVKLLQLEHSRNIDDMKNAWKAFKASKPHENEAGLVECTDWIVRNIPLKDKETLQSVVRGIGHVFNVCQVMLYPNTPRNSDKALKFETFYGLLPCSMEMFAVHPKERPLCLAILPDLQNKPNRKKGEKEILKKDARQSIAMYLLEKAKNTWLGTIGNELLNLRNKFVMCESFLVGTSCPSTDDSCQKLHRPQTIEDFRMMIQMDLLLVEFEANIQSGVASLMRRCPASMKVLLETFVAEAERDFSVKYQACTTLWNDLIPSSGHSMLLGAESRQLMDHIANKDNVQAQLKQYLMDMWQKAVLSDKKQKRLKSIAVKQTEVFLMLEFGHRVFRLDTGKQKLDKPPVQYMTRLEQALDHEIARRENGRSFKKNIRYYTLMMTPDRNMMNVQCVARRFTDAYKLLYDNGDPYEAVVNFCKFINLLDGRRDISFFPDLKHYIMWLEVFTIVAILTIAKLKLQNFTNIIFVLPNHYQSLLMFVEATFPKPFRVKDIVDRWTPQRFRQPVDKLERRLEAMAFGLAGYLQRVQIMDHVFNCCRGDPALYTLAERMLILATTLICNVGKCVSVQAEFRLMEMLTHIDLPEDAPERLQKTFRGLQASTGIQAVMEVLEQLLEDRGRGEELIICAWKPALKERLETRALLPEMKNELFSSDFFNENTLTAMHTEEIVVLENSPEFADEDPVDAEEQTPEEIERGQKEKAALEENDRRSKAALRIQRWYRKHQGRLTVGSVKKQASGMFSNVTLDKETCGFCGIYFPDALKEKQKFEASIVIGAESVLNTGDVSPGIEMYKRQASDRPQQDSVWGKPAQKQPQTSITLEDVRTSHILQQSHQANVCDFQNFEAKFTQEIEPKVLKVKALLLNPDYRLSDSDYVGKHYDRHQMDIGRLLVKHRKVEEDTEKLFCVKAWSEHGTILQTVTEMMTDYSLVEPYVQDVQSQIRKRLEEERQLGASASATSIPCTEDWDEEDDIQNVVDEPVIGPRKQRFKGKKHRKRQH